MKFFTLLYFTLIIGTLSPHSIDLHYFQSHKLGAHTLGFLKKRAIRSIKNTPGSCTIKPTDETPWTESKYVYRRPLRFSTITDVVCSRANCGSGKKSPRVELNVQRQHKILTIFRLISQLVKSLLCQGSFHTYY